MDEERKIHFVFARPNNESRAGFFQTADGGTILLDEINEMSPAMPDSVPFRSLAEEEAAYIRRVLAGVGGNKSKAAEILRIDRKTLRDKLKPEKDDLKVK